MWSFPVVLCTAVILGIHSVNGYLELEIVESNNGNCVGTDGKEHAVKEEWVGEQCTLRTCYKQGDDYYQETMGCGVLGAGPGCRLVEGTGDYPDCCHKIVCDGEERKKRGKYADYETQY